MQPTSTTAPIPLIWTTSEEKTSATLAFTHGQLDAKLPRAAEPMLDQVSLPGIIEMSVRAQMARRTQRSDFISKGLAAAASFRGIQPLRFKRSAQINAA